MKISIYGNTLSSWINAACLAHKGDEIHLYGDLDLERAKVEPSLSPMLESALAEQRITLFSSLEEAIHSADIHIIALHPDRCDQATEIAQAIAEKKDNSQLLIIQSTFTPGKARILGQQAQCDWVVWPDFMPEGNGVENFMRPDRIVLGSDSEQAIKTMRVILKPYNRNRDVIVPMSPESAELTKYATNAMLAMRISFMNEMAEAAEHLNADIEEVRLGLGADKRIGYAYLYPGTGFGGPSFERDLMRMQDLLNQTGGHGQLLQSVRDFNEYQKEILFRKAWTHFNGDLKGKTFTVWGASYKPGTSDITGSPALKVIEALLAQGAHIKIYAPSSAHLVNDYASRNWNEWCGILTNTKSLKESVKDSHGIFLMTEWKAFWSPDFAELAPQMVEQVMFDGRNIYDPYSLKQHGFTYYGIGRNSWN